MGKVAPTGLSLQLPHSRRLDVEHPHGISTGKGFHGLHIFGRVPSLFIHMDSLFAQVLQCIADYGERTVPQQVYLHQSSGFGSLLFPSQ